MSEVTRIELGATLILTAITSKSLTIEQQNKVALKTEQFINDLPVIVVSNEAIGIRIHIGELK